jgi:hypothetical protein
MILETFGGLTGGRGWCGLALDLGRSPTGEVWPASETTEREGRARQHIASSRRILASATEQRRLLDCMIATAQRGDFAGLEGVPCV